MNHNDTHDLNYTGSKPTVSDIGTFGNGPESPTYPPNLSDGMAVTESETKPVTIALNDVTEPDADGRDQFPETATCELEIITADPDFLEVQCEHNGLTYVVEHDGVRGELTGVFGREEIGRPGSVPNWLAGAVELVGIDEVTL